MTPPNVTSNPAEYYAWLQWAMTTPDPAARDETPKPDNERSARTCCGDSPRSIDRRAVSRAAQPDPRRDTGNNATAPEQTIDGATPLNRDPCHNSFCPSEDKRGFYPAAVSRGGNQGGGGGFTS
jgi:hypothetical protein